MIIQCNKCKMYFDDEFRVTLCPHEAFPANDGNNNFKTHQDSYLSKDIPRLKFDINKMRHIEAEARKLAKILDKGISKSFGERLGFTLFLFSFETAEFTYISNAERVDMIRVVEEWLNKQRNNEAPTTFEQRN